MKKTGLFLGLLLVASLVLTACGGGGSSGGAVREVTVKALDSFTYDPVSIEAKVGETLKITLDNTGNSLKHTLTIEGTNVNIVAEAGQKATGEYKVEKSGEIKFICTEPGHESMVGHINAHN